MGTLASGHFFVIIPHTAPSLYSRALLYPSELWCPPTTESNLWYRSSHLRANLSPEEPSGHQLPTRPKVSGGRYLWLIIQVSFGDWESLRPTAGGRFPDLFPHVYGKWTPSFGGWEPPPAELGKCPGRPPGTANFTVAMAGLTLGHLQGCVGPEPQERDLAGPPPPTDWMPSSGTGHSSWPT